MERLKVENLGINFGGLIALKDINFSLDEGEIIGLIGPNGSGKTTFFNLITGIYQPTKGRVLFNKEKISGLVPHDINREGIARTFQNSRLFWSLSALDNVLLGMHRWESYNCFISMFNRNYVKSRLKENIKESIDLIRYFSEDLVDKMNQKAQDLSQADKKRVEICRALASRPELLLLDEPSAGMNPEETTELMKDIKKIQEKEPKLSIIIIEHDMRVIKESTERIMVLNYGKVIFEGKFEEATNNREVITAYFGGEV